jgi:formiminotetrahydrofolate cyclodeaminase
LLSSTMSLHEMKLGEVLDAIAAKSPTPGGGAVAAMTCALGASLAHMVVQYSLGKKSLAPYDSAHRNALAVMQRIREHALRLADADAAAYSRLNELWRLKDDDPSRQRELPAAVEGAIDPPLQMLQDSLELLRLLSDLCGRTNRSLNSDLAIAAVLADSAVRAAAWNVRINLPQLSDQRRKQELDELVEAALKQSREICEKVERSCGPG